ncbi:MAG: Gfo/Idh/MocA family oxidoreductase, partial [Candidatus Pacebacteria bacterium]|nr:Gfo/Idh/MocA family oxidoreductase [Candidatus Paceibacterota bacterium]
MNILNSQFFLFSIFKKEGVFWQTLINEFDKTGMVNVVGLCDVDLGAEHTKKALAKYPNVKRFKDFRDMFDKIGNEIEAVAVSTPDFSHFPSCMLAMSLGKHVFVEKPM